MRWVTVASACRMQFRAWPPVLKAKLGSWRRRRWSCRGKTHTYRPGSPLLPERAASLSPCASSYLLVTRGSTLTERESSWWRETLSIATKHVRPPPPVNLMQSAHTSVRAVVVSGGKQMPDTRRRLLCSENLRSVFQPQDDGVKWLAPCKCCKTADFLDTRRGCYDSLHKH